MDSNFWDEVLKSLENKLSPQVIQTWFKPLKIVDLRGDLIIIEAPNKFYKNWVEEKYLNELKIYLKQILIFFQRFK